MFDHITTILGQKFLIPTEAMAPEATLEDLGLDSLDVVELALAIEKEVGIRLTDDELAEAADLGSIVELVTRRRSTA